MDNSVIKTAQQILDFFLVNRKWDSLNGWVVRLAFLAAVACFLLWLLRYVIEFAARLVEAWQKLGLSVVLSGAERIRLRRRTQFCRVLQSDLATLAKAENWNDQWFTDLEAEVEIEGRYYVRYWDRLIRKPARGLRRVPSLMEAVSSSDEQFLLIVGEPGSGKSVALRHLANELATKAGRSKARNSQIPLYVNLKELPAPPLRGPTADFIRDFVVDNVRRGDADTAAYVREHWDDYRQNGGWFFLFDSFDEIPAVMHAPSGSRAIEEHAAAIRQFLQGMSSCRGVLATREFKGPKTLPWQKLRVLPLNAERQEQLVENSFLVPELKRIVYEHIGRADSKLLSNPLFLTLLCRFVKDEQHAPANDHELVARHISRLALRDAAFTKRHYNLDSKDLLRGAGRLSVLLAEDPALSLSPTRDEILSAAFGAGIEFPRLDDLLSALVDVKIARCDVREAREGDRRFAFSHRRFQETLYVQYLAANPERIRPLQLLTDERWREYAVTFLQTQAAEPLRPLLDCAGRVLAEATSTDAGERILSKYGGHLTYFEWAAGIESSLVRVLQEGLAGRRADVPEKLAESIESFLLSRWSRGDCFDRVMVLTLGGLIRADKLMELIKWAVENGPDELKAAAYSSCTFLAHIPEDIAGWLRRELSGKMLMASSRSDVLKIRAWASRLPPSVGTKYIVERCLFLRSTLRFIPWFIPDERLIQMAPDGPFRLLRIERGDRSRFTLSTLVPALAAYIPIPLFAAWAGAEKSQLLRGTPALYMIQGACVGVVSGWMIVLAIYSGRSVGKRLSVFLPVLKMREARFRKRALVFLIAFTTMLGVTALPGVLLHIFMMAVLHRRMELIWYLIAALASLCSIALTFVVWRIHLDKRSRACY